MNQRKISESTVRRLSLYLRLLREARPNGTRVLSSRELAERTGTTSAQVRKDLNFFGSFGKRGRGYDVDELERTLAQILGLQRRWRVALIGVGKIGSALLGYGDLARRGFDIVAAFDVDGAKVGRHASGVDVSVLSSAIRRSLLPPPVTPISIQQSGSTGLPTDSLSPAAPPRVSATVQNSNCLCAPVVTRHNVSHRSCLGTGSVSAPDSDGTSQ